MRLIYTAICYLLAPFLLLRLWWKGRHVPAYRQRINERFAWYRHSEAPIDVWLHAVSLGEVIAVIPLINQLVTQSYRVLVTTMTPTGSQRVQQHFGDQIAHYYIPYDLAGCMRRFFKQFKPKVGLIVETELWPAMIDQAHRCQIPLLLINARLSQKSLQGYKKLGGFIASLLNQLTHIYAQAEEDAQRFIRLGAKQTQVSVLGNIKFDLEINLPNAEQFKQLKQQWGARRPVVILASTHDNEEQLILEELAVLQAAIPDVLVLIVPRHPERFNSVIQLARQLGFNTGQRSQPQQINEQQTVVVIDSLGELLSAYQVSDYAFIGGSLVAVGGHNMLEAIAMCVPVWSGKYTHNFKTIVDTLVEAQAMVLVDNAQQLMQSIIDLHQNQTQREQLVRHASLVLEANRGVIGRYIAIIESRLSHDRK